MAHSNIPPPKKARPGRPRTKNGSEATKTLDRGLYVLEQLGDNSLTLSEISQRTSLHPSTTSRLIRTLCLRGFVSYDEETGLYQLGHRLSSLAGASSPQQQVIDSARPMLEIAHRQWNETVNLTVREENAVVYVDSIESTHPLRMFTEVGARVPLHATGAGKAIVMGLDDARIHSILGHGELERFTEHTLTNVENFIAEVRRSESRGYALDQQERQKGVVCVAARLELEAVSPAAISVSAPLDRFPPERQAEVGQHLAQLLAST